MHLYSRGHFYLGKLSPHFFLFFFMFPYSYHCCSEKKTLGISKGSLISRSLLICLKSQQKGKVQLFWEGHKNMRNRPYGFEIYLVNVIRTISQIFVAFSEKLNFIKWLSWALSTWRPLFLELSKIKPPLNFLFSKLSQKFDEISSPFTLTLAFLENMNFT